MITVPGGMSLLCAGLDHWFEQEPEKTDYPVDPKAFVINEWRLQRLLGVHSFRLPPDFREERAYHGPDLANQYLTVPFLRFPTWYVCSGCEYLTQKPLTTRQRRILCPRCEATKDPGRVPYLQQVPFIAFCKRGHLRDFPWKEWVHRSVSPECDGDLFLKTSGGSTLFSTSVRCEKCGARRTLGQISRANDDGTETDLSNFLDKSGAKFLCSGHAPWLGLDNGLGECGEALRGGRRNAANVYYAQTQSAIYLPRESAGADRELLRKFDEQPLAGILEALSEEVGEEHITARLLQLSAGRALAGLDLDEVERALETWRSHPTTDSASSDPAVKVGGKPAVGFRLREFDVLRTAQVQEDLVVRPADMSKFDPHVLPYLRRINLVTRLRETRVFTGFSRVYPESPLKPEERRAQLWRKEVPERPWLPAYVVRGEGLFIELVEDRVREWEQRKAVRDRIAPLAKHYDRLQKQRHLGEKAVSPRFVLCHTLAHVLINQLTFECGYSSASLRERLYISEDEEQPMAGLLLYTAAGDTDGTMGGLVRMGRPGLLEPVLDKALDEARWCSADPVCMESAARGGQGPDSCNLAACHNCALLPETACEEFNRFLDRALLVGTPDEEGLGFFGGTDKDGAVSA